MQLIYATVGVATFLIALAFRLFSPLGHAEGYLRDSDPLNGDLPPTNR